MATKNTRSHCCLWKIGLVSSFLVALASSIPVNKVPLASVSDLLIQSALDSLNDNSPTGRTYKSGFLISAQKLSEPPYIVYRLTLNLEANCSPDEERLQGCPREACAMDVRQHEGGVIDVDSKGIQCMDLYPQSNQSNGGFGAAREDSGIVESSMASFPDQEQNIESLDKRRAVNDSVELDHEVQTVTDRNERPFIAVRATDRSYCAGCPYELNPSLASLATYAEQIAQSMDEIRCSKDKHKVVSIVRVTRAVPPGSNVVVYEFLLEIGQSTCPRIGVSARADCSLQKNVPVQLCLVRIEQRPWRSDSRKIVRNNCTDPADGSSDGTLPSSEFPGTTPALQITREAFEGPLQSANVRMLDASEVLLTTGPVYDGVAPVTEETVEKKTIVDRKESKVPKKVPSVKDKYKIFDDFLVDFDLPIRNPEPEPVDPRTPVEEDLIRPVVVTRPEIVSNEPVVNRGRRSIVDGKEDETELIERLARRAVDELDLIDVDDKKRVLLEVIDSRKQAGERIVYYLTMKVATSNCPEGSRDCVGDLQEQPKICKAQIELRGDLIDGAKVSQSQCFDELKKREARQMVDEKKVAKGPLVGGLTFADINDPEIKGYTQKGLEKLSKNYGKTNEPFLVEIIEATSQVVAGISYKIKVKVGESSCPKGAKENCQLKEGAEIEHYLISAWSRPWLDEDKLIIEVEPLKEENVKRSRRSDHLLGGPTAKDINDPEIKGYTQKGLEKLSKNYGKTNEPFLVEIIEATSQVVAGMSYKIKVKVGESSCPKGTKENCQLKEGAEIEHYLISAWSRPWLDEDKLIIEVEPLKEENVKRSRRSGNVPGGLTSADIDDPEIKGYAQKGLEKLSKNYGKTNEPFLVEIIEATSQVVAGTSYKIKVKVGESSCPKGTKENCQLKEGAEIEHYLISAWSRPWLDEDKLIIEVEPLKEENVKRSRRSGNVPGGLTSADIDNPEIKGYAQKGLEKLSKNYGKTNEPFLVEIIEATSQVVAGMSYKIKVKVGESSCPKGTKENCQLKEGAEIEHYLISAWSRPWLDEDKLIIEVEPLKEENVKRSRRSGNVPGGLTSADIDNPEIKGYAQKGLEKLSKNYGKTNEPFLVEIIEATSQVVAGMSYKIKVKVGESSCPKGTKENCQLKEDAEIEHYLISAWSRPWLDEDKLIIEVEPLKEENVKRSRRSGNVPGGLTSADIDDPEIKGYAQKGLEKLSKNYGKTNEPFLVEIIEATSQVVAGMSYKIKVKVGESSCPKGTKENCQLKEGAEIEHYLISAWSRPWLDEDKLIIEVEPLKEENVKRSRRSGNVPGGLTSADIDDPEIKRYAQKGLEKLSKNYGKTNEPYLVEIVEASSQFVAGKLFKIKIKVGESNCPKGEKQNCQLKDGSDIDHYLLTVLSQPWTDKGNPEVKIELIEKAKNISKRSLRGQNYSAKMLKIARTLDATETEFASFMERHGKSYESEKEKFQRLQIFRENMKKVEELRQSEMGTATYGPTIFADLTPEEFRSRHLGLNTNLRSENDIPLPRAEIPNIELPESFDWRHYNVVTEVKNQGGCGSCWAFSVTGNIESLNAIKHGELLSLSEQELVDCDTLDEGCEGGLPDSAYRSLESLGGLELESDYPYDGKDETCNFDKNKARVRVVSGLNITSNETEMAQWLVQNGPISIGINANAMQFYMGGISHPYKFLCNGDNLDHGVLIVGYGIHTYPIFKKKMPYWIVKNSWGPRWGEQGYYRVYRGDGTCGLNRMATSAVIE